MIVLVRTGKLPVKSKKLENHVGKLDLSAPGLPFDFHEFFLFYILNTYAYLKK